MAPSSLAGAPGELLPTGHRFYSAPGGPSGPDSETSGCGDRSALLRERAELRARIQVVDQRLASAQAARAEVALTWQGRGLGKRPLFLARCAGQGTARPLRNSPSSIGPPESVLVTFSSEFSPRVGQIVNARSRGAWRPARILRVFPDTLDTLLLWEGDSVAAVLPYSELVAVLEDGTALPPSGRPPGAASSSSTERSCPPCPPLTLGQYVLARFYGKWYPARVRGLLPATGQVQVLWTAEHSISNLPFSDVRPAFCSAGVPRTYWADRTGRNGAASSSLSMSQPSVGTIDERFPAGMEDGEDRWPPWAEVALQQRLQQQQQSERDPRATSSNSPEASLVSPPG